MENLSLDYLSIAIAAVLYVLIHFCWYSPWLFRSVCMELDKAQVRSLGMFVNLLMGCIVAFFLAFFEGYLNVTSVADGMFVAFCVWLGFVATTQFSPVIWHKTSIRLFFVHTGVKLLSYLVMGGIIGA